MSTDDPLLNADQVAALANVSKPTLRGYLSRGHPSGNPFPAHDDRDHVTGVKLWRTSTIEAWMARRQGQGTRTDLAVPRASDDEA